MKRLACLLPVLSLVAALGACAHDTGGYPSLAPRPIEKLGFAEPETTPLTAKPDPALDAEIATQTAALERVAKGFDEDAAKAERAGQAAHGQPAGSEAWLAAQSALATLDDWHAQASSLVTDLEQRGIARAAGLQPAYPALEALHARAVAEADREAAAITRLQAALPAT